MKYCIVEFDRDRPENNVFYIRGRIVFCIYVLLVWCTYGIYRIIFSL